MPSGERGNCLTGFNFFFCLSVCYPELQLQIAQWQEDNDNAVRLVDWVWYHKYPEVGFNCETMGGLGFYLFIYLFLLTDHF